MSSSPEAVVAALLLAVASAAVAAEDFPGIGRAATAAEVEAWDIDVRPDFLGLPPGSGSATKGRELYAAQCAACHGVDGKSDAFFTPLIGGTSEADIASGRVAALVTPRTPTLFMKLATISSLFDYIQRAMPWTAPNTLAPDEVYAITAHLLNLAGIVPDDFTLSNDNIADVQKLLPNRHGMTTDHDLWPAAKLRLP